jgi:hypothetical protein
MADQNDARKKIHRPALKRTDFYPIHPFSRFGFREPRERIPVKRFLARPFSFLPTPGSREVSSARQPAFARLLWRNPESSFIDFV